MDLDSFLKICIENALLLTLYTFARQQLQDSCKDYESKMKLGVQIAHWILEFKSECLEFEKEGKLSCLLYLFSECLSIEIQSNLSFSQIPKCSSFVESIAQLLLKLSQDRVTGGLWATLGFGPKSKFSLEFRFFCKGIGTFMASRCLPLDSPERKEWIESVEGLHSNSEYDRLLLYLDPLMDDYLCNPTKDLSHLSSLVQEQCLVFNLVIRFT